MASSDTVSSVTYLPLDLPPDLGAEPWSQEQHARLFVFLAQAVNEVCAGFRPRDASDHRGIAQDGMQWNLARFRQTAPQHQDKRWTVAFLLGCQVRAMMARRRSLAVAVARAISEFGYRPAALTIWRLS